MCGAGEYGLHRPVSTTPDARGGVLLSYGGRVGDAVLTASEERVAALPWAALAGLGSALEQPLAETLSGTPAERVLDRTLRKAGSLDATQRQAFAEAVFGVSLWRLRLRALAGQGAGPLALLATFLADLGRRPDAAALAGARNAPSIAPGAGAHLPPPLRYSVPLWLWATLEAEAGPDAPALADALNLPGPVTLRANTLRTTRDALVQALAAEGLSTRPGALAPTALHVTSPRPNLWGSPAWQAGLFEVQDEGSQLLGLALGARPGDQVLDLCAGAGGKTLLLAAEVGPSGIVHAADPDLERLERLRTRAARAGAHFVRIHGASPPPDLVVARVLVDAPCSELGALRRGPDLRHRLDPTAFASLPVLQRDLLERALQHLAPGGTLAYATCTLRHEENEDVARTFGAAHPELRRVPASAPAQALGPDGALKLSPLRHGTDGFYAAVWTRSG